jgi:tetratricopeptide (TPR) repeat protein
VNLFRPAVMGLALFLTACQGPPAVAQRAPAEARDPATEGSAAFARRDWATAAPLLREAIGRQPESVSLHYSLGVCASHLGAFAEAANEFRWVLENAPSGSEEAAVARGWLAQAIARPTATNETAREDPTAGAGRLSGFITWNEPGQPPRARERQVVLLQGIRGTPTAGLLYRTRTDERGQYEMRNITAGPYKVTDAIAGQALWRLKIVIEPDRPAVLDLSPDNSLGVRDDFPETSRAS